MLSVMKKAVSLLLFVSLVFVGCVQNQKATAVATVNGVEISSADFDSNVEKAIQIVQAQNPQALQQPNAKDIIGKRILNEMILKELFLQQAKKSNIEATQEEINAITAKVKEQFKINKDGKELTAEEQDKVFKDALKAVEKDEEAIRKTIFIKYCQRYNC